MIGVPLPQLDRVMRDARAKHNPWSKAPRYAADPESPRNLYEAMCCLCPWGRDFTNTHRATDAALAHGQKAHGDPFMGFVRIVTR